MIKEDRELLHRMATVNQGLGGVVLGMTDRLDGGELHPDDLRSVGRGLLQLGADMLDRAEQLKPGPLEPGARTTADESPDGPHRAIANDTVTPTARLELADRLKDTAARLRASVIPHEPPTGAESDAGPVSE